MSHAPDSECWDDLGQRLRSALAAHESDNGEALARELGHTYELLFQHRLGKLVDETWAAIFHDPRDEVSSFSVKIGQLLSAVDCAAVPRRHLTAFRESIYILNAVQEVFERHHREGGSDETGVLLESIRTANSAVLQLYAAIEPASQTQH